MDCTHMYLGKTQPFFFPTRCLTQQRKRSLWRSLVSAVQLRWHSDDVKAALLWSQESLQTPQTTNWTCSHGPINQLFNKVKAVCVFKQAKLNIHDSDDKLLLSLSLLLSFVRYVSEAASLLKMNW